VADLGEADQLELRRSPRAQISQGVAAIDDHRAVAVDQLRGTGQDAADREMNRAANVRGLILLGRQDVDDLRA
jgi:hypothetical protein